MIFEFDHAFGYSLKLIVLPSIWAITHYSFSTFMNSEGLDLGKNGIKGVTVTENEFLEKLAHPPINICELHDHWLLFEDCEPTQATERLPLGIAKVNRISIIHSRSNARRNSQLGGYSRFLKRQEPIYALPEIYRLRPATEYVQGLAMHVCLAQHEFVKPPGDQHQHRGNRKIDQTGLPARDDGRGRGLIRDKRLVLRPDIFAAA